MKPKLIIFALVFIGVNLLIWSCRQSQSAQSADVEIKSENCEIYFDYLNNIKKDEGLLSKGTDSIFIRNFRENIKCFSNMNKTKVLGLFGKPNIPDSYKSEDIWQYYLSKECNNKIAPIKKCQTILFQFDKTDTLMYLPAITLE